MLNNDENPRELDALLAEQYEDQIQQRKYSSAKPRRSQPRDQPQQAKEMSQQKIGAKSLLSENFRSPILIRAGPPPEAVQ